ncbi:MAG: hypothetical protein IPK26_22340 [Planctomycetes bacterium]|nr:hypothetical protein [Planctomycetota bacterium]
MKALLASADRVRAAGVVCLVGGEWLTVNVNLTVLHEGMDDPHRMDIERDGVCALDVLLGRLEIDELLTNLEAGRFRLPAVCKSAAVPGVAHVHGSWFRARCFAERDLRVSWPCDELTIQGGGYQCDTLATRFDRFLRALPTMDPPIAGRHALQRELDIYGDVSVDRGGGHVYLRCPLPLRFARAVSTEVVNELEIVVEAYGAMASSFCVGVMPSAGRRSASRILASEFERISESQFRKRLVIQEPGPVKLTLIAREGEVADEVNAGVPWVPMLVHQQFDPGCKVLANLLLGRGLKASAAREFEAGVAWLLHLCGCAAMHLGGKAGGMDLQAAPDVVAMTAGGEWLIAECSVLAPTELKVEKLRTRAQAVAELLQRAGVPARVHTVFFVAVPCSTEFEGTQIVDRNRIEDMLNRLRDGRPDGFFR